MSARHVRSHPSRVLPTEQKLVIDNTINGSFKEAERNWQDAIDNAHINLHDLGNTKLSWSFWTGENPTNSVPMVAKVDVKHIDTPIDNKSNTLKWTSCDWKMYLAPESFRTGLEEESYSEKARRRRLWKPSSDDLVAQDKFVIRKDHHFHTNFLNELLEKMGFKSVLDWSDFDVYDQFSSPQIGTFKNPSNFTGFTLQ